MQRHRLLTVTVALVALLTGCAADDSGEVEDLEAGFEDLEAGFEDLDDDTGDGEPLDPDPGIDTDDEVTDGDGATDEGEATPGAEWEVAIVDNAYVPGTLEIEVGDTVTWTHEGSRNHTVTARDFDSGVLSAGDVFAVTFDEVGTVPYGCTIHDGMAGEIIVG